jgi:hypothetical protein
MYSYSPQHVLAESCASQKRCIKWQDKVKNTPGYVLVIEGDTEKAMVHEVCLMVTFEGTMLTALPTGASSERLFHHPILQIKKLRLWELSNLSHLVSGADESNSRLSYWQACLQSLLVHTPS